MSFGEWNQTADTGLASAQATFESLEVGQLLLERSPVEMPEAPDGVSVYGCDAANGTYYPSSTPTTRTSAASTR